jgi:hypothetical protein
MIDVVFLLPSLIGAIGGSFAGTFVNEMFKRNAEKKTLRNHIINTYLIQLQYSIQTFLYRLDNMIYRGGAE